MGYTRTESWNGRAFFNLSFYRAHASRIKVHVIGCFPIIPDPLCFVMVNLASEIILCLFQCYTDESTQDVQDPSECLSSTEQHQLVSKNLSLALQNKKLEESQHHIQQNEDLTTLHNLLSDKEALLASCEAEVQAQIEKATHFETSLNNLQVQFDQIKYENLVLKKELLMKDQEAQEISTPSLQLTSQIKVYIIFYIY